MKNVLKSLPHFDPNHTVRGPYIRKQDGRLAICENNKVTRKYRMKLLSRYLAEQHLEKWLSANQQVDHIDSNKFNDHWTNLQVVDYKIHNQITNFRNKNPGKNCPIQGFKIPFNAIFDKQYQESLLAPENPIVKKIKEKKVRKEFDRFYYWDEAFYARKPHFDKKSGRYMVKLVNKVSKEKRNITKARYLMENFLKRKLNRYETVDHIDKNKTNDVLENLQVLSLSDHAKLDAKRILEPKYYCVICESPLPKITTDRIKSIIKRGNSGPFCLSCYKQYRSDLLKGLVEKLPVAQLKEYSYYCNKDAM